MDDVPPEFRKVLEHSRRQGQRRMGAGSTIGRLTNFEETEEERQRRAAAGGADGRLTDNYHQLLVAVHQLEQLLEKPELKLQEMKAHFVDDLWEYVFEVGHYSFYKRYEGSWLPALDAAGRIHPEQRRP